MDLLNLIAFGSLGVLCAIFAVSYITLNARQHKEARERESISNELINSFRKSMDGFHKSLEDLARSTSENTKVTAALREDLRRGPQ